MRVYIRHSNQAYDNKAKRKLQFDPPLTDDGKYHAEERAIELIDTYGVPDKIISSPYLRTRQTADIIAKVAKYTSEIEIEPRLSEYLHPNYKNVLKNLRPETKFYDIPYNETHDQLRERIEEYHASLTSNNQLIFIIAHSFCIHHISDIEGKTMKKKLDYMGEYVSEV